MVVKHSCQKVVGCSYCVEVSCEVKVDILHGNYLSVSAACSTALDTEYGAKRWFTESYHGVLSDLSESVCQTNGCCCLTFTCRCRCDSCYQDELAVRLVCMVLKELVVYLSLVLSVLLKIFFLDTSLSCDLCDEFFVTCLCDLDVRSEFCHNLPPNCFFILFF